MKRLRILLCLLIPFLLADLAAAYMKSIVWILIFSAIELGLLIAVLYLAWQQSRMMDFLIMENKKNKQPIIWDQEEKKQLEAMRQKAELSSLQYQINPHFLYNTLDTIRGQALLNNQKDIAQMTEKLSRFFRYSISRRENMVKVEEELGHIMDYFYIQKRRFGNRFEMQVHLHSPEVQDYYMPKMVLQPLVENAISHGLEKVKRKGLVEISVFNTEKKLMIQVTDNGMGMSEEKLMDLNRRMREGKIQMPARTGRHNGIAIQNINSRIRMMFGDEYGIHYQSEENQGTCVSVSIPLIDAFNRAAYEEIL